jgi:predicted RecB family nuclease
MRNLGREFSKEPTPSWSRKKCKSCALYEKCREKGRNPLDPACKNYKPRKG